MLKFKSATLIAAFAFFLLVVSSPARAQSNTPPTYICINLSNGQMRGVYGLNDCKNNEISMPLSVLKGDKGERGLVGAQGPAGPQGATGPKGDKGETGAAGQQGSPGQSVTVISVPPGANCTNGGSMLTDSNGNHFICNGATGAKGDTGAQGPPGPGGGGGSEVFYTKTRVSGFDGGIASSSSPGGFVEMATLTLPEGSYLVSARAILRYSPEVGVTDSSFVICKLSDGTLNQEILPTLSSPRPPGRSDFLASATLPLTFGPGGGTAHWACSATPNDAAHTLFTTSVQVWAIRASALHTQ